MQRRFSCYLLIPSFPSLFYISKSIYVITYPLPSSSFTVKIAHDESSRLYHGLQILLHSNNQQRIFTSRKWRLYTRMSLALQSWHLSILTHYKGSSFLKEAHAQVKSARRLMQVKCNHSREQENHLHSDSGVLYNWRCKIDQFSRS